MLKSIFTSIITPTFINELTYSPRGLVLLDVDGIQYNNKNIEQQAEIIYFCKSIAECIANDITFKDVLGAWFIKRITNKGNFKIDLKIDTEKEEITHCSVYSDS